MRTHERQPPSELLDAAAEMISAPGAWTQQWFARDASGLNTESTADTAVCWCAHGALNRLARPTARYAALAYLMRVVGPDVAAWNDARVRTQADVVSAFREAAELARSEGQ